MISKLPSIYKDEMVYSWFCRYLVYNGIWRTKDIAEELFVNKNDVLSKLYIGNINNSVKNEIEKILPMNDFIKYHTMLYAHTGYCSKEFKDNFLHNITKYPYKTEINISGRSKDRCLKYCPACVKEDRIKYGEAYWHNIHQLRDLRICPKHKCCLYDTSVRYYGFDKLVEKPNPLELLDLDVNETYDLNKMERKLVDYTNKRFYKHDIVLKNITYGPRFVVKMSKFYYSNDILLTNGEIKRMEFENKRSFYTMSAIYYYLESHA